MTPGNNFLRFNLCNYALYHYFKSDFLTIHNRSRNIQPENMFLMALRFFASGSMQLVVGDAVGMAQSTVSTALPKVCDAILLHRREYIRLPATAMECYRSSCEFARIAELPNIIGAIDCTHVRIQSLGGRFAEVYRNRKGYFSLNVQTISDSNLKILDIVARWPGSTHDQTIFINSAIRQRFERGDFGPYILIGDSGYGNTRYLATPYTAAAGNQADRHVQRYNRSLVSTRNVVERQYGVWKRRFPIIAYGMRLRKVQTIQKVILATAILHNRCIDERQPEPPTDDDFLNMAIEQGLVRQNEQVYLPDGPNARPDLARDRLIARLRERFP